MELTNKPSECAFHSNKSDVCSPAEAIQSIKKFLEKSDIKASGAAEIIEIAKEKTGCDAESCLYKKKEIKEQLEKDQVEVPISEVFKPKGPAFTTDWLSNVHIDEVLDQLEKKHPEFLHIPYQVRDFAKIAPSEQLLSRLPEEEREKLKKSNLKTIDFYEQFKKGKTKFGTVVNTDYSSGRGIHWFAIFVDLSGETNTVEYFNSSGENPLSEIQVFLDYTKHKLEKETGKKTKITINRIQHQTDGHSCGPYSLYYIISRLSGVPYMTFHTQVIPDEAMVEFRKHLFRHG